MVSNNGLLHHGRQIARTIQCQQLNSRELQNPHFCLILDAADTHRASTYSCGFDTNAPHTRASTLGIFCAIGLGLIVHPTVSETQTTTVERSAKGPAARNIQVGIYLNVKPDRTSAPLPAIRMLNPPANGTLSI